MENDQNKLGSRLDIVDLDNLEYALEYVLTFEDKAHTDLREHMMHLWNLFHQLRTEGERGGYDAWIIQEILP